MNAKESRVPKAILPVSQILPFLSFEDRVRIFEMPKVRFIGKSIKDTLNSEANPIPDFFGEYCTKDYHLVTNTLPHIIPNRLAYGATNENEGDAYAEDRVSEELQKLGFSLLGPMCEFYPDLEKPSFCVLFSCTPIVK